MAETNVEPTPNVFDQIDASRHDPANANPFDAIGPEGGSATSATGAFARGAARSLIPAIGSLPAIGAGAEAGAALGSVGGPIGAGVGGVVGGFAGALLGSTAIARVQNWALSKLPDSWREKIGMDDRQEQVDMGEHPVASFLGGLAPYALTMRPGATPTRDLPENATALQRIMAHPATARVFGGAAMGGMELGQEEVHEGHPDWTKVAIATGFGLVFNRPTKFGERLIESGARPARAALGTDAAAPEVSRETSPAPTVAAAADAKVAGPGVTEGVFQGTEAQEPSAALTAQDAARTERAVNSEPAAPDVHDVARRMNPELFDQYDDLVRRQGEFRRWIDEYNHPPQETLAAIEKRVADLRAAYDGHVNERGGYKAGPEARRLRAQIREAEGEHAELLGRADRFASGQAEETADVALARKHLLATEFELRDLGPHLRAAYRRAADAIGGGTVEAAPHVVPETELPRAEPPQGEAPAPAAAPAAEAAAQPGPSPAQTGPVAPTGKPLAEQKAFIAQDVARQLVAAGRPADEAEASGAIVAARYAARASRMGGELGSAEDLYRREGAEIRGTQPPRAGGGGAPPTPAPPLEPKPVPTTREELAEFLRAGGEVEAAPRSPVRTVEPVAAEPEPVARAIRAGARKGPRARNPETYSLLEFLSEIGGLRKTPDLMAIFGGKNPFIPGFGRLLREKGMSVDRAREAAVESGYLQDEGRLTGRVSTSTERDLLDAIDAENRGKKQYKMGVEGRGREIDPDEQLHQMETALDSALDEAGIPVESVTGKTRDRVLEIMAREGVSDPIVAFERAVMEEDQHAVEAEKAPEREEHVPGWDVPDESGAAPRPGGATAFGGERGPGAEARAAGERDREPNHPAVDDILEYFQRKRGPRDLIREREAEGQDSLFGRISDAELAQRKADEPLRPSVDQKPMEEGLFGTGKDQKELFQRISDAFEENGRLSPEQLDLFKREVEALPPAEEQAVYEPPAGISHELAGRETFVPPIAEGYILDMIRLGAPDSEINRALAFEREQRSTRRNEGAADWHKSFSQGARGKVNIAPGRKPIVTLFSDANASTFMHESGHIWLEEMLRDAEHPAAPNMLKDDADTVLQWLGAHSAEDVKTKHHEKFARGFEQYLREGRAPSSELAGVFAKFKQWLVQIYQTVKGLGKPINDDIRAVFDRMLSEDPERTVIAPEREHGPSMADIHEADAAHTDPHEADAGAARIEAEAARGDVEIPPRIAHEIEAERQARAAAGGTEPAAEGDALPGEEGGVGGHSGVSQPQPGSGGVRPQPGSIVGGGGKARDEGSGLSRPEQRPGGDQGRSSAAGTGERQSDRDHPLAPKPTDLFGKEESPFVDKAGNIQIENLTTSEDVARAIREAAEANDEFIGDRRGVVTDGQVMDLANDIGVPGAEDLVHSWVRGRAYNAEQVMALRKLLIDSATRVSEAMKQAATSGADADIVAYAQARDRHHLIQRTVAGATAEAGRALRAFRDISGEVGDIDAFLKSATGKTLFQLRREVQLGAQLDTPQQVSKFMHDARTRSFGRMMLEYWVNGLISGPATHTTYMIGNEMLALLKAGPETAAAAALGRLRQIGGREGDIVRFGEVTAALRGHVEAIPAALQAAGSAFRSGTTTLLPGESGRRMLPFQYGGGGLVQPAVLDEAATYHSVMAEAFGMVRGLKDAVIAGAELAKSAGVEGSPMMGVRHSPLGAIPDIEVRGMNVLPVGTAVRLPGRFIAAIHSFFRTINYSMAKNAMAYRTAVNEGLDGTALASRVGELRQNPSPEIMGAAVHEATELTLMGQGGEFMRRLSSLTNVTVKLPIAGETQILKFIDPFVHIAGNVINQSIIRRTPIGLLSTEVRADLMGKNGTVAQDMASARMLVGTAMGVVMGSLAANGYASGSGPSDPKEAAVWRLAGNQAHSVRVGDLWYDIHRLGPLGMLLGIAADLYEVAHLVQKDEYADAVAHFHHALTQNILDESFVRGPAELIRAVEDSDRYGPQYVRNFLSSFVPFSVGMAQMARASDPYSRQARTVVDAIKNKVPGLSESLLPRRDIWGEPMPNREALLAPGVTSIWVQAMSKDPVNLALLNLGVTPGQVQRKIRNVDLSDEQYDTFARTAGRMSKQRLDVIVRSPDWQVWPPHIQRSVVEEVIKQSREAARGYMMLRFPQIVKDATEERLEKFRD